MRNYNMKEMEKEKIPYLRFRVGTEDVGKDLRLAAQQRHVHFCSTSALLEDNADLTQLKGANKATST